MNRSAARLRAPGLSGTIAGMASFTQTTDEEPIMAGYRIDIEERTLANDNFRAEPLRLHTVHSPAEHPDGTIHRTKQEADEYEREHRHG